MFYVVEIYVVPRDLSRSSESILRTCLVTNFFASFGLGWNSFYKSIDNFTACFFFVTKDFIVARKLEKNLVKTHLHEKIKDSFWKCFNPFVIVVELTSSWTSMNKNLPASWQKVPDSPGFIGIYPGTCLRCCDLFLFDIQAVKYFWLSI